MLTIVLVLLFLALSILVGIWATRWVRSGSDFLIAGREVSTFIMFCSFASVAFAASVSAQVPAFTTAFGFWPGVWWMAGIGIVYIIIGFTSMRWLRHSGVYTVGEWVGLRYGKGARSAVSLAQFFGLTFGLAANLAGLGLALVPVLKWDYGLILAVVTVTFVIYMYASGAWGGTINDTLQFLFGFALYVVVAVYLVITYGGLDFLGSKLNLADVFAFPAMAGKNVSILSLGGPPHYLYALTGWLFFSFASQHYYVKVAATRSVRATVVGTVGAGVFAIVFAVMLAFFELYAQAITPPSQFQPPLAFGLLIAQLPSLLGALLVVGLLAAGISTVAAVLMANASIAARDFYQAIFKPDATPRQMLWPSRLAVLVTAAIGFVAAFMPGGPAQMLAVMGAFIGITGVLLLVGMLWARATPQAAAIATIAGIVVAVVWRFVLPPSYFQSVDTAWPAAVVALVLLVALSFVTEPRYFGRSEWRFGKQPPVSGPAPAASAES